MGLQDAETYREWGLTDIVLLHYREKCPETLEAGRMRSLGAKKTSPAQSPGLEEVSQMALRICAAVR